MRQILTVIVTAVLVMAFPRSVYAQHMEPADSVSARDFILPATLIGTGAFIHSIAHDSFDVPVRDALLGKDGKGIVTTVDDYLMYVPAVMAAGMSLLNVPTVHKWTDIWLETSMSMAIVFVLGKGIKFLTDSPRPDGMDNNSFPSGHCSVAFAGAELVRCEYGWKWGLAAYGVASSVAVLRLCNNAHWLSDVVFGAGMGILSAQISRVLLNPVKNVLGIGVNVSPAVDPVSGTLCASLAFVF